MAASPELARSGRCRRTKPGPREKLVEPRILSECVECRINLEGDHADRAFLAHAIELGKRPIQIADRRVRLRKPKRRRVMFRSQRTGEPNLAPGELAIAGATVDLRLRQR